MLFKWSPAVYYAQGNSTYPQPVPLWAEFKRGSYFGIGQYSKSEETVLQLVMNTQGYCKLGPEGASHYSDLW